MTEIERIKDEGWLSKNFWEDEIRCDYFVSSEMKQNWAIMLDLYKEFSRVCKENSLDYFVFYGTIIGAIRHEGFIPWDDDLDVCMPRKSYDKLKQMTNKFSFPYFLQNVYTDSNYGMGIQRLTNSNTTLIVEPFKYCKFNHGIHLDIVVIDNVDKCSYLEHRDRINTLIMQNSARMRINHPSKDAHSIEVINKYYQKDKTAREIFDEIEAIASSEKDTDTEYVSPLTSTFYSPEKTLFKRESFSGYLEKPFESITVRVPIGYDEICTTCYGDYMTFPEKSNRTSIHQLEAYPEIPYKEYYERNFGLQYK